MKSQREYPNTMIEFFENSLLCVHVSMTFLPALLPVCKQTPSDIKEFSLEVLAFALCLGIDDGAFYGE